MPGPKFAHNWDLFLNFENYVVFEREAYLIDIYTIDQSEPLPFETSLLILPLGAEMALKVFSFWTCRPH
jgi:hypothetical protein